MRGKDLLECMEQIDDALVEEAMEPPVLPRRNSIVFKWGMAAACAAVLGISATVFWPHQGIKEEQTGNAGNAAALLERNTAADSSVDAANSSESSLTAGAVAENTQTSTDGRISDTENDLKDSLRYDSAANTASDREKTAVGDAKQEATLMVEEDTAKLKYTIISGYYDEKDSVVCDYPVPEKGSFFCCNDLQTTMEHYEEAEATAESTESPIYAYEVVIDIYGDIESEGGSKISYEQLNATDDINNGKEMIEQEYRRLEEFGYAVRLSEDFCLTGTFTKMELDTFQPSPEYGYVFRFADEF